MKKLMMAAAIVCAAVASQAASIDWKTGYTYNHAGSAIQQYMTEYVYTITASQYGDATFDAWAQFGADALAGGAGAAATGVSGRWTSASTAATPGVANKSAYVAVILLDNSVAADGTYYFAEKSTVMADEDGNASMTVGVPLADSTGAKSAWQSVPEPTSGLLLLLGVAGLALKRKRA